MKFELPARKWLIAALAAASFQSVAIGWMVWDRVQLLRHGREVVLPVVPVDPRSLFRGDYVILSYEAQRVPVSLISTDLHVAKPASFYVTLAKTGDTWKPVAISAKPQPISGDQVQLKGRSRFGYWPLPARPAAATPGAAMPEPMFDVRYGIEAYFVPEGKGGVLEQTARDKKLSALIAVDAKGNAAIKGLMVDGRLQYEEPLL